MFIPMAILQCLFLKSRKYLMPLTMLGFCVSLLLYLTPNSFSHRKYLGRIIQKSFPRNDTRANQRNFQRPTVQANSSYLTWTGRLNYMDMGQEREFIQYLIDAPDGRDVTHCPEKPRTLRLSPSLAFPRPFNSAALFNIGFVEASKLREYDCFILYDVDLIPQDDRKSYTCGDSPIYWEGVAETFEHDMRIQPPPPNAGLLAVTRPQFLRINGASNLFFGFDGEISDLRQRVNNRGMSMDHRVMPLERYSFQRRDVLEEDKSKLIRKEMKKFGIGNMENDGLSTLAYSVLSTASTKLFLWYNVVLDQRAVVRLHARKDKSFLYVHSDNE